MVADITVDLGQLSLPAGIAVVALAVVIALRGIRVHLYQHDDKDDSSR